MIVHEIRDRARVVAEWFGIGPIDETTEQPLTQELPDDRRDFDPIFVRLQLVLIAFFICTAVIEGAAQIRIGATHPPAPVVAGSYYLEHNEGQR